MSSQYKDEQRRRSRNFKMTMSGNLSYLAHDWFKSGDHQLDMIGLGFVGPLQSRFSEKDRKERNKNSQKIESIQQNVLFVPKGLWEFYSLLRTSAMQIHGKR